MESIGVESLADVVRLVESRRGGDRDVRVIILAIEGLSEAGEVYSALDEKRKELSWKVENMEVVSRLSALYAPLFLAWGRLDGMKRHRNDGGIRSVKKEASQLLADANQTRRIHASALLGPLGEDPAAGAASSSVREAGVALGVRIARVGGKLRNTRKLNKRFITNFFNQVEEISEEIEEFVGRVIHLPAAAPARETEGAGAAPAAPARELEGAGAAP